ncbi:MAG: zinc-dependent metalloprotease family protein, partial [Bacteroidota bacterium]
MRLALAAALVAAFVAPLAAQPSLFAPVDGARIVLDDRQQEILGLLEGELGVDAVEIVRVDDAALTGGADLRIDLLSVEVLFSAVSVATRPSGHVSWYGRASGPTGATWGALVTRDGMVTGEIHFGGRVYPVRPLTGGLHAVARKSMAAYQAHPEGYEAFVESNRERLAAERAEDQARLAAQPRSASMTTTVDVLVPYTTNVAAAYADPFALAQSFVDVTNAAYDNSGLPDLDIRLVDAYATPFASSGNLETDLNNVTGTTDGIMDEVHARRTAYGADLVALLSGTNTFGFCGIAFVNSSAASG